MVDLNNCTFTGRLIAQAVQKQLPTGTGLIEFSIANNTGFGNNKKTLFLKVNLWGKAGQSVFPYLYKGKNIAVSGSLSLNTWTGQDGLEHSQVVLDCNQVVLLADSGSNGSYMSSVGTANENNTIPDRSSEDPVY